MSAQDFSALQFKAAKALLGRSFDRGVAFRDVAPSPVASSCRRRHRAMASMAGGVRWLSLALWRLMTACAICAAVGSVFAQEAPRPLKPQTLLLMVDATGRVTEVRYQTQAPPAIRELVGTSVQGWRFAPKLVDGQPVPWATQLELWLVAERSGGAYRLKVDQAVTHNLFVRRGGYPDMPVAAIRSVRDYLVCADLTLGEYGEAPAIVSLWVDDKPVGPDNTFRRSMRASLPRWKIEPLVVDGQAYGSGSVRVTVDYSKLGGGMASALFAMKCRARPLIPVGSFRLLSPVVGRYLGEPAPPG